MSPAARQPRRTNPLRDPRDKRLPRIAGPCGLVHLRRHRRPRPQEADAGGLRPGQPRPAAARASRSSGSPGATGPTRTSARSSTTRSRAHARTPFREEVWKHAVRGHPVRARQLRRRRRLRPARARRSPSSTTQRGTGGNHAFYLSIPPRFFADGLRAAATAPGCPTPEPGAVAAGRHREAVRPRPEARARAQRHRRRTSSRPTSVFRIDHYLGKETVQNLLALRFANQMFEPVWNANYVDHVQITMAEDIGIGGRAGYYDGIGAARDVIQNHLLQLLALTAMEEPVSFDAAGPARREGEGALAVRLPADLGRHRPRAVRRRLAGRRAGRRLPRGGRHPAELDHRDVSPRSSSTIDTRRWAGRAVLPAHRQAARPAGHRDRRGLQAGAAPAVRADRHRGARPERRWSSGCSPTRASPCGSAPRCPGTHDGGPRRHDGLRLRRRVHRVLARRPTSGSSSTCCSATRRSSRGTRRSSCPGRSSTRSRSTGHAGPGSPSSTPPAPGDPTVADAMMAP